MLPTTICALATSVGRSGIGIIRVSGELAELVALSILKKIPKPRTAELLKFYDENNNILDQGIALFFKAPRSFTGEDILELHAHGGPVLLDLINQQILALGVLPAQPGEFSARAFLNKKMDLTKAEAIADIIDAASTQAVLSASKSLQGEFAEVINLLVGDLTELRMLVESTIDFSEEELDFIDDSKVSNRLLTIKQKLAKIHKMSTAGSILREGLKVVIAGEPNVGKSSLLNLLSQKPAAIVTDVPGTTRDVLTEYIQIDGIPLHIIDTAGLRSSDDVVEQTGIQRAYDEIKQADCVLVMQEDQAANFVINVPDNVSKVTLHNKIDLSNGDVGLRADNSIGISIKTGAGIDALTTKLKQIAGFTEVGEGVFLARRRHLLALELTEEKINAALVNLSTAPELLAEDLRLAQVLLGEITGQFTSDDLLGKIFQDFCIGK